MTIPYKLQLILYVLPALGAIVSGIQLLDSMPVISWLLIIIGGCASTWLAGLFLISVMGADGILLGQWHVISSHRSNPLHFFKLTRLKPLRECAEIAFEQTRGSLAADIAKNTAPTDESLLKWYATALAKGEGKPPLYGKCPPDRRYEEIPQSTLAAYDFTDDLDALSMWGSKKRDYTDLRMRASDFQRQLREIQKWG